MPLSISGRPDREDALVALGAAIGAGMTLLDTADAYCLDAADTGHGERLIGEFFRRRGRPDGVLVATKGGHVRGADGSWLVDGRPEHLRVAVEASLRRLGVDVIDLYQHHRPDPRVPYEESVGALGELRAAGKVRAIGISNANVQQILHAVHIAPIVSVQNELSPWFATSLDEVALCQRLGLTFLAWAPLGGDARREASDGVIEPFDRVAQRHGVSRARVLLAWELALSPCVVPIPGSRTPRHIVDVASAVDLVLDAEDRRELPAWSVDP